MKIILVLTFIVTISALASTAQAGTSASYTFAPEVLASGSQAAFSANYSFVSTIGQPFTGFSSSPAYSACSGFWCEIAAVYKIYLPIALKSF